jgi:hypothetical protein
LSEKDDAAMQKAMDLMKAHQNVTQKLDELGQTSPTHAAAAENIRNQGGRWDSPETRAGSGRDGGRG